MSDGNSVFPLKRNSGSARGWGSADAWQDCEIKFCIPLEMPTPPLANAESKRRMAKFTEDIEAMILDGVEWINISAVRGVYKLILEELAEAKRKMQALVRWGE